MKLEYTAVYDNSLYKFDILLCTIKVKGHGRTLNFFPIYRNANCQTQFFSQKHFLVIIFKNIYLMCKISKHLPTLYI